MKNYIKIGLCISLVASMHGKSFDVFNKTPLTLKITWKSNGFGLETKSGIFELKPESHCISCIETYHKNCVHILFIESLDRAYKVRSKPFCENAQIIITLEPTKNNAKKLKISVHELEESGESL